MEVSGFTEACARTHPSQITVTAMLGSKPDRTALKCKSQTTHLFAFHDLDAGPFRGADRHQAIDFQFSRGIANWGGCSF